MFEKLTFKIGKTISKMSENYLKKNLYHMEVVRKEIPLLDEKSYKFRLCGEDIRVKILGPFL